MYLQNKIIGLVSLKWTSINFISVASLNLLHSSTKNNTGSYSNKQTRPKMDNIHAYDSYVYWTVHHLDSLIKIDQLDVTCFIISLFTAQHFSNVITSIFRSLRLIVDLYHVLYCSGSMCVGVTVWFGWGGVVSLCRLQPA